MSKCFVYSFCSKIINYFDYKGCKTLVYAQSAKILNTYYSALKNVDHRLYAHMQLMMLASW